MRKNKIIALSIMIGAFGYIVYYYSYVNVVQNRYGMMRHHYGYYDNYSSFDFYIGVILLIISIIAFILGLLYVVIHLKEKKNDYIKILDQRLSKGEISITEYRDIKEVIEKQ